MRWALSLSSPSGGPAAARTRSLVPLCSVIAAFPRCSWPAWPPIPPTGSTGWPGWDRRTWKSSRWQCGVDKAALTGEFADFMATSLRRAVATGVAGWRDDDLAFTRPWGFELAAIERPVSVWQGG
jgi:hypothetical protein